MEHITNGGSLKIKNSVALVTGSNRGMGRHFVEQLLARGVTKVYAAARDVAGISVEGAEVVPLDITEPADVVAAAARAGDVSLLINNAGFSANQNFITGDLDEIRREMETNYFGTLAMCRAFAPILAANGGGAILNVLSVVSWISADGANGYAASKAAAWSLTNGIRLELAAQGTLVTGLHLSVTDTDMAAGIDMPKNDPAEVVRSGLDGLERGDLEVLADERTVAVKSYLASAPAALYPQLGAVP
ncbi:UNVERIFIED_CONTAM: short-subunit dehydrogenase [Williamsia faeni]